MARVTFLSLLSVLLCGNWRLYWCICCHKGTFFFWCRNCQFSNVSLAVLKARVDGGHPYTVVTLVSLMAAFALAPGSNMDMLAGLLVCGCGLGQKGNWAPALVVGLWAQSIVTGLLFGKKMNLSILLIDHLSLVLSFRILTVSIDLIHWLTVIYFF